jgi:hypothetical protein
VCRDDPGMRCSLLEVDSDAAANLFVITMHPQVGLQCATPVVCPVMGHYSHRRHTEASRSFLSGQRLPKLGAMQPACLPAGEHVP